MNKPTYYPHMLTFGMPSFMLVMGLWFIGWTDGALWTSATLFVSSVALWLITVVSCNNDGIRLTFSRSCLGVAIGSSWGMGSAIFGEVFLGIARIS